tara:strand:- start:258 stop:728 length:471 start_codon:yes stop_codon:yes gene_type:complete
MNKTKKKGSKTWFFPPYLVALSLFTSFIFENFILSQSIFKGDYLPFILGLVLMTLSVMLFMYSFVLFKNNSKNPHPRCQTTQLFFGGPFKYTRNPIYLSFLGMVFGCGICFNSFWYLIFDFILIALLHFGIILHEEKYLEKEFDKVYLEYKNSVRR